tara:strand:- start:1029 stop:1532 length:504 start_codon:yes stop_codon:yes gene_type:complete
MTKTIAVLMGLALSCMQNASATTLGQAPDFTIRDINNQSYTLSDQRGQVVVINFWATWCAPCITELPHLNKLHMGYAGLDKPVQVLAISVDEARQGSAVKAHVKSRGYKFTVVHDKETSIVPQYIPSKAIPYTVIVDQEGNIVYTKNGYTPGDEDKFYHVIESLLND